MNDQQKKRLLNAGSILLILAFLTLGWIRQKYFKRPAATPSRPVSQRVESAGGKIEKTTLHPSASILAQKLAVPAVTPEEDLQNLQQVIDLYRRAHGENPEGDNADVVSALLGNNRHCTAFLPNDATFIRNGLIVDRWGSPYFLHAESATRMTLRSAGPDLKHFTDDDVTLD